MSTSPMTDNMGSEVRDEVRARYGAAATAITAGATNSDALTAASCCGSSDAQDVGTIFGASLYDPGNHAELPIEAVAASLGCGNPTAIADLHQGDRVLDLGSGGGIDVLLSARRVGPDGFVYGLDMTDAMLELAERNRAEAGVENVRFLKGVIEAIPLPDDAVDVVISNCVINLSADKRQVLREAYRVLAPGGRFAVSDIVIQGQLPEPIQHDLEAWAGCIAGALAEETYRQLL